MVNTRLHSGVEPAVRWSSVFPGRACNGLWDFHQPDVYAGADLPDQTFSDQHFQADLDFLGGSARFQDHGAERFLRTHAGFEVLQYPLPACGRDVAGVAFEFFRVVDVQRADVHSPGQSDDQAVADQLFQGVIDVLTAEVGERVGGELLAGGDVRFDVLGDLFADRQDVGGRTRQRRRIVREAHVRPGARAQDHALDEQSGQDQRDGGTCSERAERLPGERLSSGQDDPDVLFGTYAGVPERDGGRAGYGALVDTCCHTVQEALQGQG